MKFRIVSALVSSVLVTGGIAAIPSFAADPAPTTTVVPTGGAVVSVRTPGMGGDMDDENMIDYQGMSGMWMSNVREPVIPAVVISQDVLADRAVVKTPYGFVAIRTGAGATVLSNGEFVNWQMAAPGAIVQLPMSEVVNGPVPHRLSSGMVINDGYMPGSYRYMHSHMDGDMDMNGGGMNGGMGMNGGGMNGGMGMGRHHGRHQHGGDMNGTTGTSSTTTTTTTTTGGTP